MAIERVAVIGAGAWGTALAQAAATAGRHVTLIGRNQDVLAEINVAHTNRRHLGMLKKVTSKHLGEQTLMGQPVTLTRTPHAIARAAPRRGEHTEEVLGELGYSADQLQRLKSEGVF